MRHSLARIVFAGLWLTWVGALSCADLPPRLAGTCGNAVVEPGEDCDGFASTGARCGARGAASQCRYECGGPAHTVCPEGFGCGQDGICRQPTGKFVAAGNPVEGAARVLVAADFDGDGLPALVAMADDDALGRRIARIVDPDGKGEVPVSVPASMTPPTVADLTGDGRADLAFADLRGVAVLRGNAEHEPDFISYPSLVFGEKKPHLRAMAFDVIPRQAGAEVIALVDSKPDGAFLFALARGKAPIQLLELPFGQEDLVDPMLWGRLDQASPCDTIVFAPKDGTAVALFRPCNLDGSGYAVGGALVNVPLPFDGAGPAKIDTGVRLVDMDGDKKLDLLVGANGKTFLAKGKGDGTFTAAAAFGLPAAAAGGLPLAIADLNGDGAIDYVVPAGLVTSSMPFDGGISTATYALTTPNLAGSWTLAVVADFDANGMPEVVAGSDEELNIDFLTNSGGGIFNTTSLATAGPPTHFAVGDFDGDLVNDLAFTQHAALGDEWSVAFGSGHGAPRESRQMGRLAGIEELTAARLPDAADSTRADGVDDLIIISDDPATDVDSFVFALGRGERMMLAPLELHDTLGTDLPITVAAGKFRGKMSEIAALGVDGETGRLRLWFIARDATSAADVHASLPLPGGDAAFHPDEGVSLTSFRYGAHLAAGDLDADGMDEVVMVAPFGKSGSALLVARFDVATSTFTFGTPMPFDAPSTIYTPIYLGDVDGDGKLDAIVKPGVDDPGPILVFWSDGRGGFDVAHPAVLSPSDGGFDATCIPSAHGCTLYVSGSKETFSVTAKGRQLSTQPIEGLGGGRSIASGDFDGDGLVDLALGDDTTIRLYSSVPVLR